MSQSAKLSLYDYCIEKNRIELLQDWHPVKNAGRSPAEISSDSRSKAWWLCRRGHEWQSPVTARTSGAGCPVCTGMKLIGGVNDLASQCPELAKQWCDEHNGELSPESVTLGSHKKVWWRCEKGHEWQAAVFSRVNGSGCPVCSGKKLLEGENDLASQYPKLSRQWHPTKNGALTPKDVFSHSQRRVWWRCEKGHEWQATILSRVSGAGCPVCANRRVVRGYNDFASAYPELAKQWIREKNLPTEPDMVTPQSGFRAWWRCDKGHEWQAKVSARVTHGSGCPYCAGRAVMAGFNDLKTLYPKIAAEWNYEKNNELLPQMLTAGSSRKVWWKCAEGHEWQAIVASRTSPRKHGCPYCSGHYKKIT